MILGSLSFLPSFLTCCFLEVMTGTPATTTGMLRVLLIRWLLSVTEVW